MSPSPVPVLLLARELGAGGTERQLTEIARNLDQTRFTPSVAFFRDGLRRGDLDAAGLHLLHLDVPSFYRPKAIKAALYLGHYLRTHAIQIVHAFDYPTACLAVPIARAHGVPVVLSSQRSHRGLIPQPYRQLVRMTDLSVDGIVVNCRAIESHLIGQERVPRRKIHICYNGVDVERFSAGATVRTDSITVGCVCVLRPEKNLALLLEAFSTVARRIPRLNLLVVGSGPEEGRLRLLADQLQISKQFTLRPQQEHVTPSLSLMDIFVLPSLTEALSNSLMEAMACGCAVIASDVGGNPELIEPGKTGFLFKSQNVSDLTTRLLQVAANRELRTNLGENARELIRERFAIGRAVERMSAIYELFLSGRGKN